MSAAKDDGQGMDTALYYDPTFLRHDTGQHPECAERLTWIVAHLKEQGLWDRCLHPPCRDAAVEEICLIHDRDYVLTIKSIAERGGGMLDPDTVCSADSYAAAVRAAGTGIAAVESVLKGEARNAFCLVRPPGHHALPRRPMGFCIFNNIAIAARYLRQRLGVGRVAILDWDGHHGNGTQEVFYDDPTVFYASLHAYPHWPFSGLENETGTGEGVGTTVNRPLPRSIGPEKYLEAATEILTGPMADFRPEFILISAGFDAYAADPLAGMGLAPETFKALTDAAVRLAADCCRGRVVSFLEGGYHREGLPRCAAAHLRGLMDAGAKP